MRGRRILLFLTAGVTLVVLVRAFGFFPNSFAFLARLAGHSLGLAFFSAGVTGWGLLIHRIGRVERPSLLSQAWAMGAILSATISGGLSYLLYPAPWLTIVWLVAGSGLTLALRRSLRLDSWRFELGRLGLWIGAFLVPPLLLALAPPISLDSLVYHLAVPRQFQLAGRAFAMPWNAHTFFPLHGEMLFGMALQIGGGVLAQLVHLSSMLLTLAVVGRLGGRLFGAQRAGGWGVLLLVSVPVLNLISGWAWNDWFVLLYLALALEAHLDLQNTRRGTWRVAAFAGAAAAVKYYALPLLFLLLVPPPRPALRRILGAAVVVGVILLPWYGKNLLIHGNPVYPLLSGDSRGDALLDYRGGEPAWERLSSYIGRRDLADESVGILLLCAMPLLLALPEKSDPRLRPLLLVFFLFLGIGVFWSPTSRVFSPLILVLALLLGGAVSQLAAGSHLRRVGLAAVQVALLLNLNLVILVFSRYQPIDVAFALEDERTYLERVQNYWQAFEWLDRNARADEGVLVVGESRIFYLERLAVAGTYLDSHPVSHFLSPGCDPACLARRLWEHDIRWVYVNFDQYRIQSGARETLTDETLFVVSPEEDRVFRRLLHGFTGEAFRSGNRRILRLSPTPLDRNRLPAEGGAPTSPEP